MYIITYEVHTILGRTYNAERPSNAYSFSLAGQFSSELNKTSFRLGGAEQRSKSYGPVTDGKNFRISISMAAGLVARVIFKTADTGRPAVPKK